MLRWLSLLPDCDTVYLDGRWLGSVSAFLLWPNGPGIKPKLYFQSCFYIGYIEGFFRKIRCAWTPCERFRFQRWWSRAPLFVTQLRNLRRAGWGVTAEAQPQRMILMPRLSHSVIQASHRVVLWCEYWWAVKGWVPYKGELYSHSSSVQWSNVSVCKEY